MPKKPACPGAPRVTDPITDLEIAFAHLILSGTMTDRRAAETVGLNPETAAYTKAKPRVRAYMIKHRADVREKLVDQEANLSRLAAEQQCNLNIARDQIRDRILNRLWELATLSHEVTRGSIAGQMKALAMIAAIEGLIPDRRLSSAKQPAAPPIEADIYKAAWLRKQQEAAGEEPGDPVAATEAQSAAPPAPEPAPNPAPIPPNHTSPLNLDQNQPNPANPLVNSMGTNWVPQATGSGFDALLDSRRPFSIQKGRFGRRR